MGLIESIKGLFSGKSNRKKMKESYGVGWGSLYYPPEYQADQISRINAQYGFLGTAPLQSPRDRALGFDYPFVRSLTDLLAYRANSRFCARTNSYASGLINGLMSYVIGSGFKIQCQDREDDSINEDDLAKQCQKLLLEWSDKINFVGFQEECFSRTQVDGEIFVKYWMTRDGLVVNFIEPECIILPMQNMDNPMEWTLGIRTDAHNIQKVLAYSVLNFLSDGTQEYLIIDAKEIEHMKINCSSNSKRGIPSIAFDTLQALNAAQALANNLAENCAVNAAIALIRQHEVATQGQVEDFIQTQLGQNLPYPQIPFNTPQAFQGFGSVTGAGVYDISKGMEYIDPPSAKNIDKYIMALETILNKAGRRWNAPSWIISSNTDNASYASSLTMESPFIRSCQRSQNDYQRLFTSVAKKALDNYAVMGEIPIDWEDKIIVKVIPPSMIVRELDREARLNEIYYSMGVKSLHTISSELGLDMTVERQFFEKEKAMGLDPDRFHNADAGDPKDASKDPYPKDPQDEDNVKKSSDQRQDRRVGANNKTIKTKVRTTNEK